MAFATLLPLATFFMSCWLLGWRLQPVLTGSMAPTYDTGSLLVLGPADPALVDIGAPISFAPVDGDGRLVSHRVIERLHTSGGLTFRTQGDANRLPDAQLVPARQVRGRVKWHVTGLGGWLRWLRWPRGFVVLVVPAIVGLLAGEVREWFVRRRATQLCASCCLHAASDGGV